MAKTIIGKVGITPKGQYSSVTKYVKLDAVHYKGAMYICLKECTGITPENSEYWFLSAEQGDKPINGVDYNTEEQKEEFKQAVVADSKIDIDNYTELRKREIADTTASVVEEVENAGTEQIKSILEAGTTQVSNVEMAGTEQVSNIETAGLAQIKNIEDTATAKTTEFNENVTVQTNTFNTNAQEKINAYNDNDIAKTTAYNDNATAKTQDFDNNSVEKTNEFNEVVEEKKTEFNENAESYEKRIAELEVENEELAEQMPWETTEQAESIHVEDSARYSRNKLNVFGNLKRETREGYNLIDFMSRIAVGKKLGLTIETDDEDYIIVNGTSTSNYVYVVSSYFNIDDILEDGETYTLWQERYSESIRGVYIQLRLTKENGTVTYIHASTAKSTFVVDKSIYSYEVVLQSGPAGETFTNYKNRFMIYKGTDEKEYEKYGAMPSIEYPSVPQTITGVQRFRRCGKNRLNIKEGTIEKFGLKVTIDSEKVIHVSGTITDTNKFPWLYLSKSTLDLVHGTPIQNSTIFSDDNLIDGNFTISLEFSGDKYYDGAKNIYNASNFVGRVSTENNNIRSFGNGINGIAIYLGTTGQVFTNTTIKIMLNEGLTQESYEPYNENLYTLDLGDTELCKITDESGNVIAQDRAVYREVDGIWKWQWEKNIKKIILDGTRPYLKSTYSDDTYFRGYLKSSISDMNNNTRIICDKLKIENYVSGYIGECIAPTTQFHVSILASRLTENTADALNNYLKDNQLTCYYPLLASTYEDCTEEQSKQLDELYKLYLQKGTNNIICENENGISCEMQLEYMKDLNGELDNLKAMILANESEE